jgi:LPS export ABC transporter protein LptC
MAFNRFILIFGVFLSVSLTVTGFDQQRIKDFFLTDYNKETNHEDWEIAGRVAFIFNDFMDVDLMKSKYFTKDDVIYMRSLLARITKSSMDIFLKGDVHVTNKDGMTLISNTLVWKNASRQIDTKDPVKVTAKELIINARGMHAEVIPRTADFFKDVRTIFVDDKTKEATVITCDGPLNLDNKKGRAIFHNNVVMDNNQGKVYSQKATAFIDMDQKKLVKIVCVIDVKMEKDKNTSFAQKAVYYANKDALVLTGKPQIVYYPEDKKAAVTNETAGNK